MAAIEALEWKLVTEDLRVTDVMTQQLVTCPPTASLRAVAALMGAHRVHCVVVADEAGIRADGAVELSLVEGRLVVQPITPQPLTLQELLEGVTDENLPGEWQTGSAVGKEVW